jgi:hypothetical protein
MLLLAVYLDLRTRAYLYARMGTAISPPGDMPKHRVRQNRQDAPCRRQPAALFDHFSAPFARAPMRARVRRMLPP